MCVSISVVRIRRTRSVYLRVYSWLKIVFQYQGILRGEKINNNYMIKVKLIKRSNANAEWKIEQPHKIWKLILTAVKDERLRTNEKYMCGCQSDFWSESSSHPIRFKLKNDGRERKLCLFISFIFLEESRSRNILEYEKYHPGGGEKKKKFSENTYACMLVRDDVQHDANRTLDVQTFMRSFDLMLRLTSIDPGDEMFIS